MSVRADHAVGLYLEGIRDGDLRGALDRHVGDRYVQHSTGVADGKAGFLEFFEPFVTRNPDRVIEIVRVVDDGRYVFVHAAQTLNAADRWVTTDLFDTDEGGRVVEHWDVIAAGGLTSPSGHSQTGGAAVVTDLDATESNKAVVSGFVKVVLQERQLDRAEEFISSETFTQHNPRVADGVAAFVAELSGAGSAMTYKTVHKLVGQGNFVVTLSEADFGGTDMAVFDVFRLDSGLIVEHWDNMEPVPLPAAARNSGKF